MKKTKISSFIILGLLVFLPFINISTTQSSYVGIQDDDEYIWSLSVYPNNWEMYFTDNLEETLGNLWPYGIYNLTRVYYDWSLIDPPQSYWSIDITTIGIEETGTILAPYDNTTITSTPVYGQTGWQLAQDPDFNYYYYRYWRIVNDTSSFLRQTYYLTLSFSPYGIMGVPFAPKSINWIAFITEFLGVMNSIGWLYDNISATAESNGYSLNVPTLGFENNTLPININVMYNSNGVLKDYEFSYGGKMLVKYTLKGPSNDPQVLLIVFVTVLFLTISIFVAVTIGLIVLMKKRKK